VHWLIDKNQLCPTCFNPIRGYCNPCHSKYGGLTEKSYAQFVWKKEGEDGEPVMTDIVGMVIQKNPLVRESEDGLHAEFLNADGDVIMTATKYQSAKADKEQPTDES